MSTQTYAWRKSSYSGGNGSGCVEAAVTGDGAPMFSDSKYKALGYRPIVTVDNGSYGGFLAQVKAGIFDQR